MIAVDVETFGVEPHLNSIYSVGAIDLDNLSRPFFYEECRASEGTHIEQESLDFLGLTSKVAIDPKKQTEGELVHKFIAWALEASDRTFAGQNVSFDRDFLRYAAQRAGHTDWPFAHRTIDSHSLAWMHMVKRGVTPPVDPEKKRSALDLDAILVYCGIPEEPTPHNALTGAKSHAEVISRLLYDKKLLPEFESFSIPWQKE
ncbi:MAG: Exonuclease RNase T and DNA polymerase III [Parcubacteria group bacterium Gr01-1014_56]|nr:MAG: Exonuclease RNase T and DNA polymerase III [Parcubacteria group bacterium Gr01-1014_56]